MLRFRIEPVTIIGEQRFGVTLHRAQRGAHVVRDAVRKRFQLTDGLLQGNGASCTCRSSSGSGLPEV